VGGGRPPAGGGPPPAGGGRPPVGGGAPPAGGGRPPAGGGGRLEAPPGLETPEPGEAAVAGWLEASPGRPGGGAPFALP